MEKEFIPYEQALELKELGFDEPCIAFYEPNNEEVMIVGLSQRYNDPSLLYVTDFCAPLYQQSFRWFREKYGLEGVVQRANDFIWYKWIINRYTEDNKKYVDDWWEFKTYEESELACIKKLIEIVKLKNNG
jgi:hypothetical protein